MQSEKWILTTELSKVKRAYNMSTQCHGIKTYKKTKIYIRITFCTFGSNEL